MSGSEHEASTGRGGRTGGPAGRGTRRWMVPVLLAAVLVPFGVIGTTLWTSTGDDVTFAQSERDGIVMIRPLARLVAATADLQSAAVAGQPADGKPTQAARVALTAAISATDAADAQVGAGLNSNRRWADVRGKLNDLVTASPSGAAGFTAFSQVVDLEVALIRAVADSSNLILDPRLDSYYLMDVTVLRLPDLMVDAGRAVDLTLLTEQRKNVGRNDLLAGAIAENGVQSLAASIDDGLGKSFAATNNGSVGPALLSQLDKLRDTVTALAPPSSAVGAATVVQPSAELQTARAQLRDAALSIETVALGQLDLLIDERLQQLQSSRRLALLTTLAGLLVAAATAWAAGPRRRREATTDDDGTAGGEAGDRSAGSAGSTPTAAGTRPGAAVIGAGTPGSGAGPSDGGAGTTGTADGDPDLLEARDLLDARHLVRVGRAVSSPREKR